MSHKRNDDEPVRYLVVKPQKEEEEYLIRPSKKKKIKTVTHKGKTYYDVTPLFIDCGD